VIAGILIKTAPAICEKCTALFVITIAISFRAFSYEASIDFD
jgi:hypothetical protein